MVGEAYAVLSAGDADSACLVYRHRSIGSAEHTGAANRHQSAAFKHQGTYSMHTTILSFGGFSSTECSFAKQNLTSGIQGKQ